MKNRILTLIALITLNFGLFAQTNLTYSLTRPISGGDLNLVEFDLVLGTETIIKTYSSAELNDYNPEVTAFDNQNNRFITLGYFGGNDNLIAIDVTNGNIDFSYQSSSEEIFSVEVNNIPTLNVNGLFTSDESIIIYPNPFKNQIIINSESDIKSTEISNASGKIVISKISGSSTIDLSTLPNGIYWITVNQLNNIITKMVVKQ